jgi:hypothetical protein
MSKQLRIGGGAREYLRADQDSVTVMADITKREISRFDVYELLRVKQERLGNLWSSSWCSDLADGKVAEDVGIPASGTLDCISTRHAWSGIRGRLLP